MRRANNMFENDITISGIHASYIKKLVYSDKNNKKGIFNRYIDVYMAGAILGYKNNRIGYKDKESNDRARIYADAFATERIQCEFLFRLIMLSTDTANLSLEERINRAFRDDTGNKEKHIENMKIFNNYVLGGIEILYQEFTKNSSINDHYWSDVFSYIDIFFKEHFNKEKVELDDYR
jgi:hypothetical protein